MPRDLLPVKAGALAWQGREEHPRPDGYEGRAAREGRGARSG
jgi:hypothetical protein